MMNIHQAGQIYAGFGAKQKGPRPGVLEQHHGKINQVAASLRELGHAVTNIQHSTKAPAGYAKSTIFHKSGPNKFKTHVRTAFNDEGGEHNHKLVTESDDASADASADKGESNE